MLILCLCFVVSAAALGLVSCASTQSPSSINGPLQSSDLEIGGAFRPKGASPDDSAEWIRRSPPKEH